MNEAMAIVAVDAPVFVRVVASVLNLVDVVRTQLYRVGEFLRTAKADFAALMKAVDASHSCAAPFAWLLLWRLEPLEEVTGGPHRIGDRLDERGGRVGTDDPTEVRVVEAHERKSPWFRAARTVCFSESLSEFWIELQPIAPLAGHRQESGSTQYLSPFPALESSRSAQGHRAMGTG